MGDFCLYVVDTETTGLDPKLNDIIEVSFLRVNDMQQRTWYMKPINPENIEEQALKVNGVLIEDLLWKTASGKAKYKVVDDVLPDIENWIAEDNSKVFDRVLVGHNVQFDANMMRATWEKAKCMDTYPFSKYGNEIDTKGLSFFFDWLKKDKSDKYNLSACIKKYGLESRKAHGAIEDVKMCYDLLMHIAKECKKGW